ncbi:MAG: glycosyltransferase family 2 protein [Anaerolineae bacterium]|nr:glycosyltransferase family 2 protein [Anaerolineae bacterium]
MQVSVIIPVYNAADYVRQAVESALAQPQCAEVLLIEDGSPDDSLSVCQQIAAENPYRVRLLQHPNGENRGAGPTRNLGLHEAKYEYIAFLDADDYYLPGRFDVPEKIFAEQPAIDGVYEATGFVFSDDAERQSWIAKKGNNPETSLTTVRAGIAPEELFEVLYEGESGHFDTNSIVFKRTLLAKVGEFPPLRLHQDTVMWMKLAAMGRLAGGRLDQAVAVRRIHPENRARAPRPSAEQFHNRALMWEALWLWSESAGMQGERCIKLLVRTLKFWRRTYKHRGASLPRLRTVWHILSQIPQHPMLITRVYLWKLLLAQLAGR